MSKFQGHTISQNEDGFFWQEGGYFDTLEECRADIADWNMGEAEPHEDTPSLDAPWWTAP